MTPRHPGSSALGLLVVLAPALLQAQSGELPPVPGTLTATQQEALRTGRAYLQERQAASGTDRPDSDLLRGMRLYCGTVARVAELESMDRRIAETARQLQNLKFKSTEASFTWTKGQAEEGQAHMVSQLVNHARDYALGKSEKVLKERFLQNIRTMKPRDVNRLADSLQRLGANEPLFQEWLRSFSGKASRAVLENGARMAIDGIKGEEKAFKILEKLADGTVASRQEAALTFISLVADDYPGMRELRFVASGAYDVLEAGATIFFLSRGLDQLMDATDARLANQRQAIEMRSRLVDDRRIARERVALDVRLLALMGDIWHFEREYRNLGKERDKVRIEEGLQRKRDIESHIAVFDRDVAAFLEVLVLRDSEAVTRIDRFLLEPLPEPGLDQRPPWPYGETAGCPTGTGPVAGMAEFLLNTGRLAFMQARETAVKRRTTILERIEREKREAGEALGL